METKIVVLKKIKQRGLNTSLVSRFSIGDGDEEFDLVSQLMFSPSLKGNSWTSFTRHSMYTREDPDIDPGN